MVRARYLLGIIIGSIEALQSITTQTFHCLPPLFLLPAPPAPFSDDEICAGPVLTVRILPVCLCLNPCLKVTGISPLHATFLVHLSQSSPPS